MKIINKVSQIAAIVFGLGALVMFFLPFATITTGSNEQSFIAAQLAWGTKVEVYDMARSSKLLFVFLLTAFAGVLSIFGFKNKGIRYTVSGVSLFNAIFMLVVILSEPRSFIDPRPLADNSVIEYSIWAIIAVVVAFLFAAFAIAYLFIDDYLEVKASNGTKKTILQRVVLFFRDYKSEIKKIVWPSFKDVLKNTGIVLIMCAVVGVLIWLVDFGLGSLIDWILNLK